MGKTTSNQEVIATGGEDAAERRALLVVGMHRSGTSAVARSLSVLGADLPRTPLPPGKGGEIHWGESAPIEALHEQLLASAGTRWDDVLPFPISWYRSPAYEEYLERMVEAIAGEYAESSLFVVKDPRICRLVPFWIAVLERLEAQAAFVLPVRNPLEVSASLMRRDEFSAPKGLLLWLRHVLDAERGTRAQPRAFVAYEEMLSDPGPATRAVCDHLGLDRSPVDRAEAELGRFLSEDERHHSFTAEELDAHEGVGEWVKEAYALLLDACRSGNAPDPDALDRLSTALAKADPTYGAALVELELRVDELREKVKARNKTIAEVEQRRKRIAADLRQSEDRLRTTQRRLRETETELAEVRRMHDEDLRTAHRRAAAWAAAAQRIERSRTWRLGSFLIRALRLLTFRRPVSSEGPGELAATIESADRNES